jgi:integrase
MLRYAADHQWIHTAPRIKKPKIQIANSDFRYLRTTDEISKLLRSARAEGLNIFCLYATALYTGMRAGELAGIEWSDIDLGKRLITVQRSYSGPTKNGEIRHVPILDILLPILIEWKTASPSTSLVFPNEAGDMHQESARAFQEILHRVLDRADFPKVTHAGKLKRYIVFHGLRHTFASRWMMSGGDIFKLQKILGHKSHQMTQRYSHLDPGAFAEDFDRFGSTAPGMNKLTVAK